MREIYEFRVVEDFASRLFGPDEGKDIGSRIVRLIELEADDPRLPKVGEMQKAIDQESGRAFFHGWQIRRKYTKPELEAASLFRVNAARVFEPAGEESGTVYDESTACPECGAGAQQVGPLFLPLKRIPKGKDFAETIAGEIIVSRRVVELFESHGVTGVEFEPVRITRDGQKSEDWFQFIVQSKETEVVPPTRVGLEPFDDDPEGQCRCSRGDLIGLNLLSEVTINGTSRGNADIISSHQFIGARRGLLRPRRMMFISPKVWRLIESEKLKGVEIEVAHIV